MKSNEDEFSNVESDMRHLSELPPESPTAPPRNEFIAPKRSAIARAFAAARAYLLRVASIARVLLNLHTELVALADFAKALRSDVDAIAGAVGGLATNQNEMARQFSLALPQLEDVRVRVLWYEEHVASITYAKTKFVKRITEIREQRLQAATEQANAVDQQNEAEHTVSRVNRALDDEQNAHAAEQILGRPKLSLVKPLVGLDGRPLSSDDARPEIQIVR